MVSLQTPICDFGWNAPNFDLPGIDGKNWSLADVCGPNGTLVIVYLQSLPLCQGDTPQTGS